MDTDVKLGWFQSAADSHPSWLLCNAPCRGHRQRKMMHNMQADAAGALPADAPAAAYLDQLPQPVSSAVLGEMLAMEAKAVHEVTQQPNLRDNNFCHCDEHKVLSGGSLKQPLASRFSLRDCVPSSILICAQQACSMMCRDSTPLYCITPDLSSAVSLAWLLRE